MEADDARTIGWRVRQVRHARGKSLRVGGARRDQQIASPADRAWRNRLDSLSEIVALVDALEIAPSELIRLPVPRPSTGPPTALLKRCAVRLAAVDHGHPGGQVLPVGVLRDRVAQVRQMLRRFAGVGATLPA